MMNVTNLMRASLCAAALVLTGCGGSDGGGAPPPAPPPPMIGPAGGTATGPNGAQVVVPAGALATNTAIAVAQSSSGSPALPTGTNSFGAMYAFTPHGTAFAMPATVTVPFTASSVPAGATPVLYKTNAAGAWERVANATVNAGTMTAQVTSFSWWIVCNVPPAFTLQPANVSVAEPATATFTITAVGSQLNYQWQKSDDAGVTFVDIAGATASSYTTGATSVAADNGDRYRVRISNTEGSATSAAAVLTVTANVVGPVITTQPQNVAVTVGGTALFTVVASGTSPQYQWQRSNDGGTTWIDIAGAVNASYTLSNAQATDTNARFRVRVSNAAATVFSNAATLTVNPAAPAIAGRIAGGGVHSLAKLVGGSPLSWGSDSAGVLGGGSGDQSRNVPGPGPMGLVNVVSVAAGSAHSLAVGLDGAVWAWGYGGFGHLGNGSNLTVESYTQSTWDDAGTVRNYIDARAACGGSLHSLVLRANGEIRASGYNANGQLGDGSNTDRLRGVAVSGIGTATAIACGGSHSLALLADGTVRAWGLNDLGQLGNNATTNSNTPVVVGGLTNITAIAAGGDFSLALDANGAVWSWGGNVNGQLGIGSAVASRSTPAAVTTLSNVSAIAAGFQHGIAVAGGSIFAWGNNASGQLGSGDSVNRNAPIQVAGLAGMTSVAAGQNHTFAVNAAGIVWAWGRNVDGQLGINSTVATFNTPQPVAGLNLN